MGSVIVEPRNLLFEVFPNAHKSRLILIMIVVFGTLLLTASAKISIPFYPVPMTMQTFVVMVIGISLGWKLAFLTVFCYLLEGAIGLPVFAGTPLKGIGLPYMLGPTGGYLLGFLLAGTLLGFLGGKGFDRNIVKAVIAMFLATFVIFFFGCIWLGSLIGFEKALEFGVRPFLLSETFKFLSSSL